MRCMQSGFSLVRGGFPKWHCVEDRLQAVCDPAKVIVGLAQAVKQ